MGGLECVQGVKNAERISALEKNSETLFTKLDEIREKLLGRPTWQVLFFITLLCSVASGALSYAVSVQFSSNQAISSIKEFSKDLAIETVNAIRHEASYAKTLQDLTTKNNFDIV